MTLKREVPTIHHGGYRLSDIIETGINTIRMWLLIIINYMLWLCISSVRGHLPDHVVTPSNKVEQFCSLAELCIHDTIPICGRMGDEKRTFMDVCDMLEYACDTNQIFTHIDDEDDCPVFKKGS